MVALLPPLLFAAAVLVWFRFARTLWPGRLGLCVLAAIVPALLPASLPYTAFGLLDHHAAELFWTAVVVAALGSGLARVAEGESPWRVAWAPGLALAAALLTQLSLVVLLGLALGAALTAGGGGRGRALTMVAAALGLAAICVLPWALIYARAGAPFRHFQFGLFQPALAGAAALAAAVLAALTGGRRRIGVAILFGIPLALLGLVLAREIGGGFGYVGRQMPWLASIGESQPLFADGFAAGAREAMIQLSLLALLLPIAWFRLARDHRDARRRTLLLASLGFTALGILQRRFLPHAALFVGFGAAVALEPFFRRKRAPHPALAALAVVALAAALIPCAAVFRREEEPAIAFDRAHSVLDYLRTQTSPTSHYDDPRAPAEYGVLAEWSFGHFIQYYGQRAAVTDNFGDHAGDPLRPRDFFLATREADALAVADSLRVGYVLVRDLVAGFEGLIPDTPIREQFLAGAVRRGGRATIEFSPRIEPTILYRLAWRYGSAFPGSSGLVPPLAHLRLVAESRETETIAGGSRVPYVKLYEIVPGAELRLTGLPPGELGMWLSAVRSPTGSRFPYVTPVAADSTGTIAITVPYPTVAADGQSRFDDGGFRLGREGARQIAMPTITEDDVRTGRVIAVPDATPVKGP